MRRYAFVFGVLFALAGVVAFAVTIDPQRPTQSLYRIRWEASDTGWTPELNQQAGDMFNLMGDLRTAVIHWEAANPSSEAGRQRLALGYITLQQWDNAVNSLSALLDIAPDSTFAHYYLGLILAPSNPIRAIDHLERVTLQTGWTQTSALVLTEISQNPADSALGVRVGRVLLLQNEFSLAERAFRHASEWNIDNALSLAYVGLARQLQNKDGQAWMDTALSQAPDSDAIAYVYGLYLREQGQDLASRDSFARAVQLNPAEAGYYAELGTAYQRLGDLTSAAYWLNYAVQVADSPAPYVRRLVRFYIDEDYPVETNVMQELLAQAPTDVDAITLYGWSLHLNGESERALTQLTSVIERNPQNADALYYKAQILIALGRIPEARPLLTTLSELPSQHQAWAIDLSATLNNE